MSSKLRLLALSAACALCANPVSGVRADAAEPIIITATRTKAPLRQIGSSVSLLTKDDIEREGAAFAPDALRTLPGVSVSQNGGPGGVAAVRIRGEEAYRTLVLYDGIRISDAAAPQVATNLTEFPATEIGRIEIVRGPQSLLYGADAVGGVVQILSPDPAPGLAFQGSANAGSYQTRSAAGALLYGGAAWNASVLANYYKSDGFSAKEGDPDLADADGLEAASVHGKGHVELSPWLRLEAVGHYGRSDAEFDGASAFPPIFPADPDRLLKRRDTAARAELQAKPAAWLETALSYAFSKSARDDLSSGLPFIFGSDFDGTRRRTSFISSATLGAGQSFVLGADAERLEASTDTFRGRSSGYGIYGEWQAGFGGKLFTTLGLRFDHGDRFGDHLSGRATAAYLFRLGEGETSKLHASYGTGFRAPSLFEQATNLSSALPPLHEEGSRAFDIGLNQTFWGEALNLDVTYFDQTIENEIRFDNVGFTGYFQSQGSSRSRGVEVFAVVERRVERSWLSSWRLQSAYTYTDAKVHSPDPEDGLPRVRRPRHMSASALTLGFWRDRADLTFSVRTAARAEDGFREFRVPLDDYAVLGVNARWRVTPRVEFYATGVNIANEQYEEISGYATSDAALYVGLRIRG